MAPKKGSQPWNKGRKLTEEHCRNLSLSHIGQTAWNKGTRKKRNCEICNKEFGVKKTLQRFCSVDCRSQYQKTLPPILGMLGKKQSNRQKMIVSLIHSGERNINWKGGFRTNNPREYHRDWRERNPLRVKASQNKRRTLEGNLTKETVEMVYRENLNCFGSLTCYLCQKPIPNGKDHLEHKTPLSRGGSNSIENLGIACQHCNCSKHNKTVEEFKREVCH